MGLLQGPRLMAWTSKSPIRGNHWVPLGCRAHLGSVKDTDKALILSIFIKNFLLKHDINHHFLRLVANVLRIIIIALGGTENGHPLFEHRIVKKEFCTQKL